MKQLFIIVLLFSTYLAKGQDLPYKDGDIVYELSIRNDSLTKNQMFERTMDFLNNTLNKGSVYIQSENLEDGTIIAGGATSFGERKKSHLWYELGFKVRSRFKMDFYLENGVARIKLYNIYLVKMYGSSTESTKLTEDVAEGMNYLSRLREGKLKRKTEKEFAKKTDQINDTYYTILAVYKRAIENQKTDDNW